MREKVVIQGSKHDLYGRLTSGVRKGGHAMSPNSAIPSSAAMILAATWTTIVHSIIASNASSLEDIELDLASVTGARHLPLFLFHPLDVLFELLTSLRGLSATLARLSLPCDPTTILIRLANSHSSLALFTFSQKDSLASPPRYSSSRLVLPASHTVALVGPSPRTALGYLDHLDSGVLDTVRLQVKVARFDRLIAHRLKSFVNLPVLSLADTPVPPCSPSLYPRQAHVDALLEADLPSFRV